MLMVATVVRAVTLVCPGPEVSVGWPVAVSGVLMASTALVAHRHRVAMAVTAVLVSRRCCPVLAVVMAVLVVLVAAPATAVPVAWVVVARMVSVAVMGRSPAVMVWRAPTPAVVVLVGPVVRPVRSPVTAGPAVPAVMAVMAVMAAMARTPPPGAPPAVTALRAAMVGRAVMVVRVGPQVRAATAMAVTPVTVGMRALPEMAGPVVRAPR
jgi:hypothetical protein